MPELALVFVAGFAAALVDGALGMGFGPTSSSVLLGTGMPPAAVATTVNIAKVATGIASAVAHWRFDNIDRRLVRRLAGPGAVGALFGVKVLATVDGRKILPVLSLLLLVVAGRMLARFSRPLPLAPDRDWSPGAGITEARNGAVGVPRGSTAVAATGGVTNGLVGAWGPVVTPFLLHKGLSARFAVGSVNTAEVAVAVVASGSLLASIGGGGVDVGMVLAMLGGGVLAAPAAAWAVRHLPARGMGLAVSTLLLMTNLRVLAGWVSLGASRWALYAAAAAACALAAARPRLRRRARGSAPASAGTVPSAPSASAASSVPAARAR